MSKSQEIVELSQCELEQVSGGDEAEAYAAGVRAGEAVRDAIRSAYDTVVGWFS